MATEVKRATKVKRRSKLTLKDRLSRLTYIQACQLLGSEGKELINLGSHYDGIDVDRDIFLGNDLFRLKLPGGRATLW